ncbi:uncharacterized protein LOC125802979 [Astyanax mexicanus]|uniref:uncharacterized protein LOC125802979 n=1 Tax=Astyanax mexicanus TaxID=7994 RepID=UPI0020CAF606|nr:uncharacterized protein LOC125802979 [Astyanax mexicanus]
MMSFAQENMHTPISTSVGRGRGVLGIPMMLQFESPVQGGGTDVGGGQVPVGLPLVSENRNPPQHFNTAAAPSPQVDSSPSLNPLVQSSDLVSQMSDVIKRIGQELAGSIITHLSPPHAGHIASHSTPNVSHTQSLDNSQVQLVSHRKVKDPPNFKGDSSDSVTVREWEDLMRNYIKKVDIAKEQQAEEILIRLRGRAKDIVKFGTRNSGIDIIKNPESIYSLLRKHFDSVPCSPLPLADFYSTLPKADEDAYDYWLRLNQAVDIAVDRLKEQGKSFDCPTAEVTRMFIRNCPSKELAVTFRSKTIDKWSAEEVQDVLDEYHSEMSLRTKVAKTPNERVSMNKVELSQAVMSPVETQDCQPPKNAESTALERVIGMLEKILLEKSAPAQTNPSYRGKPRLPRIGGLNSMPCTVCGDASHSGLTHCRNHKLCFQCYSPAHSRSSCPEKRKPAPSQPLEN